MTRQEEQQTITYKWSTLKRVDEFKPSSEKSGIINVYRNGKYVGYLFTFDMVNKAIDNEKEFQESEYSKDLEVVA